MCKQIFTDKLKEIFKFSSDYVFISDVKGNILDINDTVIENLGYSREDLLNKSILNLVSEDEKSKMNEWIKDLLNFRKKRELKTFKLKNWNGEGVFLNFNSTLIEQEDNFNIILSIGHDITEFILEKQKLLESEEINKSLLEHTSDFRKKKDEFLNEKSIIEISLDALKDTFFVFDPFTRRAVRWNKAFRDITGYTDAEIRNLKAPDSYYSDEDLKRATKPTQEIESQKETTLIMNLITKDRKKIPFEYINSSILDENGDLKYILSIGRDISERIKSKQRIKESELRFRTIAERSMVGISIIQDNEVKYVNQTLLDLLGYTREEIEQWPPGYFLNIVHPDFMDFATAVTQKNQSGKGVNPINREIKIIKKNGTHFWIDFYARSIIFNGKPAAMNINVDINEKKIAMQKLEESEEKYRDLFINSPLGIFLLDEDGNLLDGNTCAKNSFSGFSIQESVGKNFLEIISKLRNKEELFKIFKKRNEDRAKGKRLKPIEFKIETMNGDVKWLFWQSNVLRLKNNNLIQVIVQDFTERKKVEQLIIEENKKLLELDEIKNEIINRFSHELKTPLTSIFGAIDLLQSQIKGKLTEEESELLQHINYGSIKLRELIFKMIDSMRLDKTEIRLSFQETDIIRIIRNSYEELKYFCESRNLNIILNLPETYYFKADEERIKQVFSNLISNAIKNTPPYGVITLDLIDGDKYCDLIIKDTGVGFTDAEIKNLFQKFGKIERYGMNLDVDNEGMGLGLFISKKIIEMHNGEILVESEGRNKGSMFTIRLFK